MDNVGELIFYILVILVFVGKAVIDMIFKKKSSSTSPAGVPTQDYSIPEQANESKDFWEIFEEMQTPPPPVVKTPKKKKAKRNQVVAPPPVPRKSLSMDNLSTSSFDDEISDEMNNGVEDEYGVSTESYGDVNELRKAVIYTEILNRKY